MTIRLLNGADAVYPATVIEGCNRHWSFRTSIDAAAGSAIEATTTDMVLIGEVLSCRFANGMFEIRMLASHSVPLSWRPGDEWCEGQWPDAARLCA